MIDHFISANHRSFPYVQLSANLPPRSSLLWEELRKEHRIV